ncbi:MAG: polysaccharide deacetylase family protein [Bacillota bacterium]|nr:polysaccharide deacetylase family protein [Bacillota bacterium]
MRRLNISLSIQRVGVRSVFLLIILCGIALLKYNGIHGGRTDEEKVPESSSFVSYHEPSPNERGLKAIWSSGLPAAELPADDEKNVGLIHRKEKIPLYEKEVYLTFDDGPSKQNTMKILDILNKNGVKASFFIVGTEAEKNKEIVERLNQYGMCILPHSYSHKYSIYQNLAAYFEDLNRDVAVIRNLTGKRTAPYLRMPGGSSNTAAKGGTAGLIKAALKGRGLKYVDWNVNSLDAEKATVDAEKIKNSVIRSCKNLKFAVILMHDAPTKVTTVQALPDIVSYLKKNGFVFRTFDDITTEEERELMKRKIIDG